MVLKVLGFIRDENESQAVAHTLKRMSQKECFTGLRDLMVKSQKHFLNNAERRLYKNLVEECAALIVKEAADATVCTFAQLANDWSKGVKFDWIIVDEATTMNDAQMIQAWRDSELVIEIGDHTQLGPTTLSKPNENPFVDQIGYSPFHRFIENGYPYLMLKEVMRSTKGLEAMCSDLWYQGMLEPGQNTSLADRPLSTAWHQAMRKRYPSLKIEPQGLVYPVFFNIATKSVSEITGGISRVYYQTMLSIYIIYYRITHDSGLAGSYRPCDDDWGPSTWVQRRCPRSMEILCQPARTLCVQPLLGKWIPLHDAARGDALDDWIGGHV